VVELTIALHYVFNTPKDKLVWDVGHQAYPHKIITGRKDNIRTLRKGGGLSGFTKRSESEYDPFGAAHSSTSISSTLGIAVAKNLSNNSNHVIAVIGDGAMSAGMAFEAMNNAGAMKSKLIVILRNPIDKAYSTYNQQLHVNELTSSFEETIKAEFRRINLIKNHAEHQNHNPDFGNYVVHNIIRHGIYFNYLEKWFQIFSKEQIFVVDSNELENFTQQTLNKVFEFLDLPHHEIPNLSKINVGKYSPMSESTRKSLVEFYGPYNAKLNSLLKTNYDWNK